jgi:hypothetical protein
MVLTSSYSFTERKRIRKASGNRKRADGPPICSRCKRRLHGICKLIAPSKRTSLKVYRL